MITHIQDKMDRTLNPMKQSKLNCVQDVSLEMKYPHPRELITDSPVPRFPQLPSITQTQFTEKLCPSASAKTRVYDLFYLVQRDNFVTGDFKICRQWGWWRSTGTAAGVSHTGGHCDQAGTIWHGHTTLSHIIPHYQIIVSKLEA